ncbi:MAG TPA: STAS domain-containing protein [Solirubrobacteraceae bacterium]|nr:STAS domain-containing protein [Solirubrobacteraceae bacterium]
MGPERLAVEFERTDGSRVLLRVSGRLERATSALLEGVLHALRREPAAIVVDLSDVDHIDSHGLEVLLQAEADARRRNASVEVTGVRESLRARRSPLEE